jgi:hypothetical protein
MMVEHWWFLFFFILIVGHMIFAYDFFCILSGLEIRKLKGFLYLLISNIC